MAPASRSQVHQGRGLRADEQGKQLAVPRGGPFVLKRSNRARSEAKGWATASTGCWGIVTGVITTVKLKMGAEFRISD